MHNIIDIILMPDGGHMLFICNMHETDPTAAYTCVYQ